MRIFLLAILFLFVTTHSYSQNFSLNYGGTNQVNYFTEIKYENIIGKPIIKVTLGGKDYRFILDTGGPNVISRKLFDIIRTPGVDPNSLIKLPISDSGGRVDSMTVITVNGITLGSVVFNEIPTLIVNDPLIFDCLQVDGSIGSNMLRNSILQFSSKNQTITLTDQPEKLGLNNKVSSQLYLNNVQSSPSTDIKLRDKGSASIPMIFDTGDSRLVSLSLQHAELGEKHDIFTILSKSRGSNAIGAHGTELDTTKYRISVSEINIGGAIFNNVTVETSGSDDSYFGSDLINYGNVTLDYKNKKFYFEPFQTPVDLYATSFPISITVKDTKATIGVIWSEALKDKINIGDQLLSVDDQDYSRLLPCDLIFAYKIFEGKTKATLTFKSSTGKIKKITISKI